MKLSEINYGVSIYTTHVSEFSFRWPKVRSILWLPDYKAMVEKRNPSFTYQARLLYRELSYIRLSSIIQVQILVGDLLKGHLGSYDVIRGHQQVLANNPRLKRAKDVGMVSLCLYCHDASIDVQHDLFGLAVDVRCPWPEVKYLPDLFRSPCIWFHAPWREKHADIRIRPLVFLVQRLFAKKRYRQKTGILGFGFLARKQLILA